MLVSFLISAAFAATLLAERTRDLLLTPPRPAHFSPSLQPYPSGALTGSLMVVVLPGLREEDAWQVPALQYLRSRGSAAVARASFPTYLAATRATLLTGLEPAQHRALAPWNSSRAWSGALISLPPALRSAWGLAAPVPAAASAALPPDHLLAAAQHATLVTAAVGPADAIQALGSSAGLTQALPEGAGAEEAARAVLALWQRHPNLLWAELSYLDQAGHRHGTKAASYRQALEQTDRFLGLLLEALDLKRSTLIVVSGHGQLAGGAHGGDEYPVARLPLVAAGRGIAPAGSPLPEVRLADVGATLAALIGVPPAAGSGSQVIQPLLDGPVAQAPSGATPGARQPEPPDPSLERDPWRTLAWVGGAAAALVLLLLILSRLPHASAYLLVTVLYFAVYYALLYLDWPQGQGWTAAAPFHGFTASSLNPHLSWDAMMRQHAVQAAVAAALAAGLLGWLIARRNDRAWRAYRDALEAATQTKASAIPRRPRRLPPATAGLFGAIWIAAVLALQTLPYWWSQGWEAGGPYWPPASAYLKLQLDLLQVQVLGYLSPLWLALAGWAGRLAGTAARPSPAHRS